MPRRRPDARRGAWGTGSIHHLAWRVDDDAHELEMRAHASTSAGAHPTPVIDRFWFKSVYFKEPGGVLFELATDGPGFAVDEAAHTLGEIAGAAAVARSPARPDPGDPADAGLSAGAAGREDGARVIASACRAVASRIVVCLAAQRSPRRRRAPDAASTAAPAMTAHRTPMTATAKGPFDVKLTPQGTATDPDGGRPHVTLDKTFHGDLEATSVGEMLAVTHRRVGLGRLRRDRARHRHAGRAHGHASRCSTGA